METHPPAPSGGRTRQEHCCQQRHQQEHQAEEPQGQWWKQEQQEESLRGLCPLPALGQRCCWLRCGWQCGGGGGRPLHCRGQTQCLGSVRRKAGGEREGVQEVMRDASGEGYRRCEYLDACSLTPLSLTLPKYSLPPFLPSLQLASDESSIHRSLSPKGTHSVKHVATHSQTH